MLVSSVVRPGRVSLGGLDAHDLTAVGEDCGSVEQCVPNSSLALLLKLTFTPALDKPLMSA